MQIKSSFVIVCGHYGSGKTNLSLNLALRAAAAGKQVTLVDLDLVNPYFRSSDVPLLLEKGIRVIAPVFAGTTVDVPSLLPEIAAVFEPEEAGENRFTVLDVGGDDVGATVLGRYHAQLSAIPYELLYVINQSRNLTATPTEAAALLREIETASRCKATAVVNNTHLKQETTPAVILQSVPFAAETARQLSLPLLCTTIPSAYLSVGESESLCARLRERGQEPYPVDIYVKTVWEASDE